MLANKRLIVLALITVAALAACTSRYALDLYMHHNHELGQVNIEETQVHANQALGDTEANWKLIDSPNHHVLLMEVGTRGEAIDMREEVSIVFSFDLYVRIRLYYELPTIITTGERPAVGNSLVQVLGIYDVPPEDKLYHPESGQLVIDSISSGWLFATIDADYANHFGDRLGFVGSFKANVKSLASEQVP